VRCKNTKLTESSIDDRAALLLHSRESVDGAATFRLRACPLLQEPRDVPHPVVHGLLREVCCIRRANPVWLEGVFKVGATEERDNSSSGSVR